MSPFFYFNKLLFLAESPPRDSALYFFLVHHSLLHFHLPSIRLPLFVLPASDRVPEAGDSAEKN